MLEHRRADKTLYHAGGGNRGETGGWKVKVKACAQEKEITHYQPAEPKIKEANGGTQEHVNDNNTHRNNVFKQRNMLKCSICVA